MWTGLEEKEFYWRLT